MNLKSLFSRWWQSLFETPTPALPGSDQRLAHDTEDRPRTRRRKPRHLPVRVVTQEYDYSCVAACLQMVYEHHTGRRMSHRRAVRLTRCKPDGAELAVIPRIMGRLCGTVSQKLKTLNAVRTALKLGLPVVGSDENTYIDPHAVLIVGASRQGFYVCDPATGKINRRSCAWVLNSDEFHVVARKGDSRLQILAKHRRNRRRYFAPPIRLPGGAGDGTPRLPVATIRLWAEADYQRT